jgi:hypothetical protein
MQERQTASKEPVGALLSRKGVSGREMKRAGAFAPVLSFCISLIGNQLSTCIVLLTLECFLLLACFFLFRRLYMILFLCVDSRQFLVVSFLSFFVLS